MIALELLGSIAQWNTERYKAASFYTGLAKDTLLNRQLAIDEQQLIEYCLGVPCRIDYTYTRL